MREATRRVTANIKAEMSRQDLTQADLAELMGTTQQTVSRRLSGSGLTVDDVEAFCRALRITLDVALAEHPQLVEDGAA